MWGDFSGSTRARLRLQRSMRFGFVTLLAAAGVSGCGKKRPFDSSSSPLQPEIETPVDAAAEGQRQNASDDCRVLGCDPPGVCDPSSVRCVGCRTAADCNSPERPFCDTAAEACVRCLADADCPSQTPLCQLADTEREANRCVECTSDAGCPDARPVCDPNTNECTARCTTSAQCSPPTAVCNQPTQVCVGCLSSSDCSGTTDECDPATSRCVQCLDNGGCSDAQVCNLDTHTCVECLDNSKCLEPLEAHCQLDASVAEARFTCVGCVEDRDCVDKPGLGGRCRLDDARCVECVSDSQCVDDPAASNCSVDGACSACVTDADCALIPGKLSCLPNIGCVECVDAGDCAGSAGAPICKVSNAGQAAGDAAANTCVECTANTDCVAPGASRCVNNQCASCATNTDCAHAVSALDATTGMRLNVCDSGTCVECTGAQQAACGADACDSLNRRCSIFTERTADLCEPCVSDAHCAVNARCVRQVASGSDLGFFCVPLATGTPPSCGRVFVELVLNDTIEETESELVCLMRRATCPALVSYRGPTECDDASDNETCGIGGVCGLIPNGANEFLCTIPCSSATDCLSGNCIGNLCQL